MRTKNFRFLPAIIGLAVATLLGGAAATEARADGFIIIERPEPVPHRVSRRQMHFPLAVKIHDVTVQIKDGVAITNIDQTFYNPNNRVLEGTYMFPVPDGAAVDKFSLFIEGKEVEAEMLDRDRAREIYEGIVRRMEDPALLEYVGRSMFKARVYPIPANGTRRIKLSYSQILPKTGPMRRYMYPLNTEKFSSAPLDRAVVRVRIESTGSPVRSVYSPTHEVEVVRPTSGNVAEAVWERSGVTPDKDFVLYYDTGDKDVELSVLSFRDHDGGYFVALLSPGSFDDEKESVAKDVVFVFDTSGSMAGDKMNQSKKALAQAIGRLGDKDRFAVVDFSTDVRMLDRTLIAADEAGKKRATMYVEGLRARGGTAIDDALAAAQGFEGSDGRPFFIVFMTDGQPTIGLTKPDQIIKATTKRQKDSQRIFVLGIGADVNTLLLDQIAKDNRGDRDYVLPEENVEVTVSAFIDKISYPVLTDVEIEFEGSWVRDIYPKRIGDLFRGNQVVITGRYREDGPVAIRLRGKRGAETVEPVFENKFTADKGHGFAARLWARRKIGFLLDQMRQNGETKEVREEVVFLAKKFGIVTPYTSYLVVEDDAEILAGARQNGREARPGATPAPRAPERDAAGSAFDRLRRAQFGRGMSGGEGGGGADGAAPSAEPEEFDGDFREKTGERALRLAKKLAESSRKDKGTADDEAKSEEERVVLASVVRRVGTRTFYSKGGEWVDATIDADDLKKAKKIEAFSKEYFDLVAKSRELAECFSLGKNVVVKVDGTVYRVVSK